MGKTQVVIEEGEVQVLEVGTQGPPGVQGPAGPTGTAEEWHVVSGIPGAGLGVDGDLAIDTTTGDIYEKITGTWTLQGNIKGPQGPAGGTTWHTVTGTPSSGLGADGDYAVNENEEIFRKATGAWTCISDFDTVDGGFY